MDGCRLSQPGLDGIDVMVWMPGFDGDAACERLAKDFRGPVIAITDDPLRLTAEPGSSPNAALGFRVFVCGNVPASLPACPAPRDGWPPASRFYAIDGLTPPLSSTNRQWLLSVSPGCVPRSLGVPGLAGYSEFFPDDNPRASVFSCVRVSVASVDYTAGINRAATRVSAVVERPPTVARPEYLPRVPWCSFYQRLARELELEGVGLFGGQRVRLDRAVIQLTHASLRQRRPCSAARLDLAELDPPMPPGTDPEGLVAIVMLYSFASRHACPTQGWFVLQGERSTRLKEDPLAAPEPTFEMGPTAVVLMQRRTFNAYQWCLRATEVVVGRVQEMECACVVFTGRTGEVPRGGSSVIWCGLPVPCGSI